MRIWLKTTGLKWLRMGLLYGGVGLGGIVAREGYYDLKFLHQNRVAFDEMTVARKVVAAQQAQQAQQKKP